MDPNLNKNVGKMVIHHLFYSLLAVKPKKSHVSSILSQETKFHFLTAKRMRCPNCGRHRAKTPQQIRPIVHDMNCVISHFLINHLQIKDVKVMFTCQDLFEQIPHTCQLQLIIDLNHSLELSFTVQSIDQCSICHTFSLYKKPYS